MTIDSFTYKGQLVCIGLFFSMLFFFGSTDVLAAPLVITKLLDDDNIATTFSLETGYSVISPSYGNADYFGINPMIALDEKLYLGISTSLPAGNDGGMFGVYTPGETVISNHGVVNEQGVLTLTAFGDRIASSGVDPCCGDVAGDSGSGTYDHPWDWGNFYTFDDTTVEKYRNLPNVVHGWGSWFDEANDIFYYAASGHKADMPVVTDATLTGQLFSTTDSGETWTLVADGSDGVGTYRTYDVIGMNGSLYVQHHDLDTTGSVDFSQYCRISRSDDQGETWQQISNVEAVCGVRLNVVENHLIVSGGAAHGIYKIASDNSFTSYLFDFAVSSYHMLTQDAYGNVYAPTVDGRVMHTTDFIVWQEIASADDSTQNFNTSYFWDDQETLFLSGWGADANLWSVDIKNSDGQGLPDALETSEVVDIYRFYSQNYRSHFYTQSEGERDSLIANDFNWAYEGVGLQGYNDAKLGQLPVYRFYSQNYRSHFYTVSLEERDSLIANDPNWLYEGIAWYAYERASDGTDALYRFYSKNYQSHFYTVSVFERDAIIDGDENWTYEGVAYYVPQQ